MNPVAEASIQSASENVSCMRNYAARILEQLHLAGSLSADPDGFNELLDDVVSLQNCLYRLQERLTALAEKAKRGCQTEAHAK